MRLSNAYLVGSRDSWMLVDTGTPGNAGKIKEAAEARFGAGAKPRAILLTHGHFDHAGSAPDLVREWGVRVYVHRLEWPYLTGKSYPPVDPTTPGFFSFLTRFFPSGSVNLGGSLEELDANLSALGLGDWETKFTPGHTPGHVAFYRKSDGVLLTGDAVITMNIDNVIAFVTERQEVCGPPAAATTDWAQARRSVQLLAGLKPKLIGAGHGKPMTGVADQLQKLADYFPVPEHGRYVKEPAGQDESGITYLPPPAFDPLPKIAGGITAAAMLAGAGAIVLKKRLGRS